MKYVLLLEGNALLAQSMELWLNCLHDFEVLEKFDTFSAVIRYFKQSTKRPDLIIMRSDAVLCDNNVISKLQLDFCFSAILIWGIQKDVMVVRGLTKFNIAGMLSENVHPDTFYYAMQKVVNEQEFVEPVLRQLSLIESPDSHFEIVWSRYSDNVLDFLKYACSELTYKEIAERMNLSPKTIEGYWAKVSKQLGVRSRVGLVLFVYRNNLFKID